MPTRLGVAPRWSGLGVHIFLAVCGRDRHSTGMTNRLPRAAGLLLHPTSLPGAHGIGDLGEHAYRFVDWLAASGFSLWQVLPLVPPGAGSSPYSTYSALSGNPWLISLERLREDDLLDAQDLNAPELPPDRVDDSSVCDFKAPRLEKAAQRLLAGVNPPLRDELEAFREREQWVEEAALFAALRAVERQRPWWSWPAELRDRGSGAVADARRELRVEIDREVALQWIFDRQWQALREHCTARGVRILGDVPIYVDRDSVDVWAHRDQFQLDRTGQPEVIAGVPPDYFSETGQLWGNPIYDWERMQADGYGWWLQRLRRALAQTDLVRFDHFRGFAAYWAVPPGAQDARPGRWVEGPGAEFFGAVRAALGELPLVAEDLGEIDQPVHELRDEVGLPGMKVLQFAFGAQNDHPFLPHTYGPHCVAYTGTHDNDTTRGWWESADERIRDHVRRYLGSDGHDVVWDLIRLVLASVADTAVVPMQDLLALDSDSRMNRPGLALGNWSWRVRANAFNDELGGRIRALCALYGRGRLT
ncbi:MAG: 4-alpha-glucanotransferase [bacterium]